MSMSGFFKKVPGQSIFRGQQVDFLSWLCFVRCPLLPFFCIFLQCSHLFMGGGALCHGPTLAEFLQKSETDSKKRSIFLKITMFLEQKKSTKPGQIQSKDLFLEIIMFLGQKIDEMGQIQSCKFCLSLFDQMSFQSSVVLLKYCFDQMSFRLSVTLINCCGVGRVLKQ